MGVIEGSKEGSKLRIVSSTAAKEAAEADLSSIVGRTDRRSGGGMPGLLRDLYGFGQPSDIRRALQMPPVGNALFRPEGGEGGKQGEKLARKVIENWFAMFDVKEKDFDPKA